LHVLVQCSGLYMHSKSPYSSTGSHRDHINYWIAIIILHQNYNCFRRRFEQIANPSHDQFPLIACFGGDENDGADTVAQPQLDSTVVGVNCVVREFCCSCNPSCASGHVDRLCSNTLVHRTLAGDAACPKLLSLLLFTPCETSSHCDCRGVSSGEET